jgi:hypothetical protein
MARGRSQQRRRVMIGAQRFEDVERLLRTLGKQAQIYGHRLLLNVEHTHHAELTIELADRF